MKENDQAEIAKLCRSAGEAEYTPEEEEEERETKLTSFERTNVE